LTPTSRCSDMNPLTKDLEDYIYKLIVLHEQLTRSQQQAMLVKLTADLSAWEPEPELPTVISSAVSGSSLTPSQQQAFGQLQQFAKSKSIRYFRLVGYAGTGKSFLIAELIKWLKLQQIDYVVAAPTNKATKNIRSIANLAGVTINAMTVAQLLGQQPRLNEETGIEEFTIKSKAKLDFDIVIIDEFSMVSSANFAEMEKALGAKTKVLFVGDAAQLPPVGESEPIVATTESIEHEATLTEVIRYDGDLSKVAEQMRTEPRYRTSLYPFQTASDQSIVCLPYQEWLGAAANLIKSPAWQADPNYCRILVWRNSTADSINEWIRLQLWGETNIPFQIGDLLIAKKPVFRESKFNQSSIKKKKEWNIIVNNSEECQVTGEVLISQNSQFSWYEIPVLTEGGGRHKLKILDPTSELKRQELIQEYRNNREWYKAADLDKTYDYCPYAYCLTIHKAQGSSIDHVFLNTRDMRGCPDLQKLQYTGLTRTKIKAYVPI
jgi:AAA domain/UvrD-like helicase C-terminal domain